MSVASGIPDFRSSNGLYATLNPIVLTATEEQIEQISRDPSFSLDQHLFMENPLPCLEVNREFVLGVQERRWKATLAHRFVEMLRSCTGSSRGGDCDNTDPSSARVAAASSHHHQQQQQPKLVRLYTQNIDGLEDQCDGLDPHRRRIAVHGSMDEAECASCGAKMDFDVFCAKVKTHIKDITGRDPTAPTKSRPILCPSCKSPTVKPSIVLFRSRLPEVFFQSVPRDIENIDLLIVIGTSLAVAPANSLVWRVPKSAMRVLINREPVGWQLGMDYETHDRDFFAQGDCEDVVLDLMDELGWLDYLQPLLDRKGLPEASAQILRDRLEEKKKQKNTATAPSKEGEVNKSDEEESPNKSLDTRDGQQDDGNNDRKPAAAF
jgi:NAD-dependent SIR2 family protein deacetylase